MTVLKYSRQREAVKNYLRGRTDHPTADMVYESIRKDYPNISLGTVYRNLSLLSDLGEIQKLSSLGGSDHFDGRVDPHAHFLCQCCGRVMDFESEKVLELLQSVDKEFEGEIKSCSISFMGTCAECKRAAARLKK